MAEKNKLSERQRIRILEQKVQKLEAGLSNAKNRAKAMHTDHEALLEYVDSLMDALVDGKLISEKAVEKWDKRYDQRMDSVSKILNRN